MSAVSDITLTLTPTDRIEAVEGQECRIWTGQDDTGAPVVAFIRLVSPQTHEPDVNARFEARLQALPPMRRSGFVFDWRFIL